MAKGKGEQFSRSMGNDPNMGMNPKWRKPNKGGAKIKTVFVNGKHAK